MAHAAAECLPPDELEMSIACLQAYWNPGRHGFCAWKMFPGNEDIYYDDNAHAVQCLISAFQATGNHRHVEQAKSTLVNLILPSAQKDGGVPWHTNNQNCRNACSTGPSAVAALRICALEHNQQLFAFAQRALRWLVETLRDPEDGLIWDSLVYREDGTPDINKMKWTYNTGFAIHGFTLLYDLTKDSENLRIATQLAEAAMNCEGPLFDRSIPNPGDRMYSDGSFFLHHLMDGYFALSKYAIREQLIVELHKVAQFGRDFMFDSTDGLYFRGSCPCTISEKTTRKFNSRFNMDRNLEKNGQERDEHGNLCKTMIGNAGWARIFFLADRITPSVGI
ncbi:Six-hairpin glycosidase-like protein [Amylocarpus encephaloides]|uniref:Six-hairpin glycosidase-like protein n=1 Tax=Amylocarpus encephaloides TaxID=45428 RepID=A0A9P7YF06_9HELO|nr:Six-hairpin glycosidase-like protein [Amylocarpus encephaloides]